VLAEAQGGEPDLILIGTGSEVQLCAGAYDQLTAEGARVRLVSMPSWELFDLQPRAYREEVLPPSVTARVAVEQASTFGWERFVGMHGEMIGMHTFGASAPLKDVQKKFGFTPEAVAARCREQLERSRA
jgi:transketolase